MRTDNIIQQKSFDFALNVISAYKILSAEKKEFVMSKQLLRSGTSVGANIEEAIGAQSDRDFFAKITIAYKEIRETVYWIKLLLHSNYLDEKEGTELLQNADEIARIIGSIQKTLKTKLGIASS